MINDPINVCILFAIFVYVRAIVQAKIICSLESNENTIFVVIITCFKNLIQQGHSLLRSDKFFAILTLEGSRKPMSYQNVIRLCFSLADSLVAKMGTK